MVGQGLGEAGDFYFQDWEENGNMSVSHGQDECGYGSTKDRKLISSDLGVLDRCRETISLISALGSTDSSFFLFFFWTSPDFQERKL